MNISGNKTNPPSQIKHPAESSSHFLFSLIGSDPGFLFSTSGSGAVSYFLRQNLVHIFFFTIRHGLLFLFFKWRIYYFLFYFLRLGCGSILSYEIRPKFFFVDLGSSFKKIKFNFL